MLYVQQSLGPDEDILMTARFHWIYNLRASFWIIFGLALGAVIAGGAMWWTITSQINSAYPHLPDHLFSAAWDRVVASRGGYTRILWSLPMFLRMAVFIMFLFGLFLFAHLMIIKATTEIAVTDERVIYKRGLIARDVGEIGIDRIEGVTVNQTIVGRIFNYGTITVRGMGIGEVDLPPLIAAPIAFRNAIQEARNIREREKANLKQDHSNL